MQGASIRRRFEVDQAAIVKSHRMLRGFGKRRTAIRVIPPHTFGGCAALLVTSPLHFVGRGKTYDVGNSFRWCELSTKSFLVHHTQLLAAAAQVGDAKGIRKEITEMKMRLIKDALKATGRG